jgi:hypothetical protein
MGIFVNDEYLGRATNTRVTTPRFERPSGLWLFIGLLTHTLFGAATPTFDRASADRKAKSFNESLKGRIQFAYPYLRSGFCLLTVFIFIRHFGHFFVKEVLCLCNGVFYHLLSRAGYTDRSDRGKRADC